MVQQGLDLRLVAKLLGHRTLQMSMRYSHLAKEHLKSATSEVNELMAKKNNAFVPQYHQHPTNIS